MHYEKVFDQDPEADAYAKGKLSSEFRVFSCVTREVGKRNGDADTDILNGAAAMKSYSPEYVDMRRLAERACEDVTLKYPRSAGTLQRLMILVNAA